MPTLQDRIVWITGAGSGIGRAIANGFAAAGARVALTGRRVDALAQTASEIGRSAIVVPADVTNADQVADASRRGQEIELRFTSATVGARFSDGHDAQEILEWAGGKRLYSLTAIPSECIIEVVKASEDEDTVYAGDGR